MTTIVARAAPTARPAPGTGPGRRLRLMASRTVHPRSRMNRWVVGTAAARGLPCAAAPPWPEAATLPEQAMAPLAPPRAGTRATDSRRPLPTAGHPRTHRPARHTIWGGGPTGAG